MTEATLNIDWSKAPSGATHCNKHSQRWYRDNGIKFASVWFENRWIESAWITTELSEYSFIPRPVSTNQEVSTSVEAIASTETKPPLGLTPKNIWEEQMQHQRRQDIHTAMQRYIKAEKDIPNDWLKELIDLNNGLAKIETYFAEAIQSLPVAEEGGWIENTQIANSSPSCLSEDTRIEVEYRNGDRECGVAIDWRAAWNTSDGEEYDIIRYRIIEE